MSGQSTAAGSDLISKHALILKQQLVSQGTCSVLLIQLFVPFLVRILFFKVSIQKIPISTPLFRKMSHEDVFCSLDVALHQQCRHFEPLEEEIQGSCRLTSCLPTEQFLRIKTETGCALTLILAGSGLSEKEENSYVV